VKKCYSHDGGRWASQILLHKGLGSSPPFLTSRASCTTHRGRRDEGRLATDCVNGRRGKGEGEGEGEIYTIIERESNKDRAWMASDLGPQL